MVPSADKQVQGLLLLCGLYTALTVPVFLATWSLVHLAMVWNLFLAVVPLGIALVLERGTLRSKALIVALAALWLFFFPNAPYMVTDLIHMNRMDFGFPQTSMVLLDWVRMVHIAAAVLLGQLVGFLSLYKLHMLALPRLGRRLTLAALAVVSLAGGYAIYIGRFLRFNSWDILRPITLARGRLANLDAFAVRYTFLMGLYILFSYGIFHTLFHRERG